MCACVCSDTAQRNNTDSERNALEASALATFFKHICYVNAKNTSLLEKWPTFGAKDKRSFFKKTKVKKNYSHAVC